MKDRPMTTPASSEPVERCPEALEREMQQNNESHLVTVSQTSTGEISERLRAAGARVQQLEGELAGAREGLPMRDAEMREQGRREAETERDTLRAEVNRLNAEAGELRRKLEEAMHMGKQLAESSAVLIANRDAAIHKARNVIIDWRGACIKTESGRALVELDEALSKLDQPSEPKTCL